MKGILFLAIAVMLLLGAAWAASPEVVPSRPGLLIAQDLFAAGDYRGAERILRGCDGPSAKLLLAKACLKQGLLEDARDALVEVLAEKPGDEEVLRLLAQVSLDRGDMSRGADCLRQLIKVDPKNAALHKSLAQCESRQGNIPSAMAAANEALALDPSDREALALLTDLASNGIQKMLPKNFPGNRRPNHGRP